jgi:hypothetical protein
MRNWVKLLWLKKAGSWDCAGSEPIKQADAKAALASLTEEYGTPEVTTSNGGETVTFTWLTGGAKLQLVQQPCS